MGCTFQSQVYQLLHGGLDRSETVSILDHLRSCVECKSFLTFHSRINSGRTTRATEAQALAAAENDESPRARRERAIVSDRHPAADRGSFAERLRPRRFGRIGLFAFMGVAVFFMASRATRSKPDLRPDISLQDQLAAMALIEGAPRVRSPQGTLTERPIVIALATPPGERVVTIHVLRRGEVAWSGSFSKNDPAANFDAVEIPRADAASLAACDVLLPFPPIDVLELEPGVTYWLYAELQSGAESDPVRFVVEPRR